MLCTCEDAIIEHSQLYNNLISEMYYQVSSYKICIIEEIIYFFLQIKEVPNDFFVDIVSSNNFLATILNQLFGFVRNSSRIDVALKSRVAKFEAHLSQKFNWIFDDEEDEEDKPVVVETT